MMVPYTHVHLSKLMMVHLYTCTYKSADNGPPIHMYIWAKVGRSKPPPVLTGGFNQLKPPRSICQKVVNTGQYESEWSIENIKGPF